MDKSVEKTVTLFRKSYVGRLMADERAEMACLLEDEMKICGGCMRRWGMMST